MRGLLGLIESGLTARCAVVGEPTGLDVVVANKGIIRFSVVTKGKAVHSSRPDEGVNAIYRMGRVVQALEAYAKGGVGREKHPLLGKATLSVGVIRGGEYVNVVPDRCEIDVDRRLLPGDDGRKVLMAVRDYLSSALEEDVGLEVSGPDLVIPPLDIPSGHALVQAVSSAAKDVVGRVSLRAMPGTTHAGQLMAAGIPALVFGPGGQGQSHTATEELSLSNLEKATAVYERLMLSGCE